MKSPMPYNNDDCPEFTIPDFEQNTIIVKMVVMSLSFVWALSNKKKMLSLDSRLQMSLTTCDDCKTA